jgi:hypothetical protein
MMANTFSHRMQENAADVTTKPDCRRHPGQASPVGRWTIPERTSTQILTQKLTLTLNLKVFLTLNLIVDQTLILYQTPTLNVIPVCGKRSTLDPTRTTHLTRTTGRRRHLNQNQFPIRRKETKTLRALRRCGRKQSATNGLPSRWPTP